MRTYKSIRKAINRWFHPTWQGEYFKRFIVPQIHRARDAGIPQPELDNMWSEALKRGTSEWPPGLILRDLIDAWINTHD